MAAKRKRKSKLKGKKHSQWGAVKAHPRRVAGGLFGLASRDKSYKAAKRAKAKATARAKAAWKKAQTKAKKKMKALARKRR